MAAASAAPFERESLASRDRAGPSDGDAPLDPGASDYAGGGSCRRRHPSHHLPPLRQISSIDAPRVTASVGGSVSNLVNSIVGAGIVGIPFAVRESGLAAGAALLVAVSVFTDKSLRLIVDQATFHPRLRGRGVRTFEDLLGIPYGRVGRCFVLASMLVLAYGAMVAYLLIVKDTLPTVLGLGDSFWEREGVMVAASLAVMLPLSMVRDISQLAGTSLLSVAADAVLVLIVAAYAPVRESVAAAGGFWAVLRGNLVSPRLFIGLGVLSTAMACQHSAFLISNTLENHTSRRWARVTGISLLLAGAMSLLLGVVGYLGFLRDVQGDILNNFDPHSRVVNAARALLALTMFFTYPMEAFVARHVLAVLLFQGRLETPAVGPDGEALLDVKWLGWLGRRERWTCYLYLTTLAPALIVDDLGPVLSLTGSLGASSIAYIGPGLVYFGLNGDTFLEWIEDYLHRHGYSRCTGTDNAEIELPVVGDASAKMAPSDGLLQPSRFSHKPWWWLPALMPVWVYLAHRGSQGTRQFFAERGIDDFDDVDDIQGKSPDAPSIEVVVAREEVAYPTRGDFCYSIVFIVFGVVAAVAGVSSNIYVQIKGL